MKSFYRIYIGSFSLSNEQDRVNYTANFVNAPNTISAIMTKNTQPSMTTCVHTQYITYAVYAVSLDEKINIQTMQYMIQIY